MAAIGDLLKKIRLTESQFKMCREDDFDKMVPDLLDANEALVLKLVLREEELIYKRYTKYVGFVIVDITAKRGNKVQGKGNCVLCGEGGLVITAHHVVAGDEDDKVEVTVVLPNTIRGRYQYKAKVVENDEARDLALLSPISRDSQIDVFDYLSNWGDVAPSLLSPAILLSFPESVEQEYHAEKLVIDEGKVVFVHDKEALASYTSFGGCSGGLVLSFVKHDYGISAGIHKGIVHESEPLVRLNLLKVNKNFMHKGAFGQFDFCVQSFIAGHFSPELKESLSKRHRRNTIRVAKAVGVKGLDAHQEKGAQCGLARRILKRTIRRIAASQMNRYVAL